MKDGATHGRRRRRVRTGIVKSDRGDKTIAVTCPYKIKHPVYGKYIGRRTVLYAHDESNQASVGDRVEVMECRPISKMKHWRLVRIVASA